MSECNSTVPAVGSGCRVAPFSRLKSSKSRSSSCSRGMATVTSARCTPSNGEFFFPSPSLPPSSDWSLLNPIADGGNDGDGKKNSPFEGVHLALVTVAIPREHDDERDFDDFRRLKGGTDRKS